MGGGTSQPEPPPPPPAPSASDTPSQTPSHTRTPSTTPSFSLPTQWFCGTELGLTQLIRRNWGRDIECMSLNGWNCLEAYSIESCMSVQQQYGGQNIPLICGSDHFQKYGSTGYSNPSHWCAIGTLYIADFSSSATASGTTSPSPSSSSSATASGTTSPSPSSSSSSSSSSSGSSSSSTSGTPSSSSSGSCSSSYSPYPSSSASASPSSTGSMSVSASSSMSKSSKASFTASPSAKPSDHARGPPPSLPEDLSVLTPELLTYYVQDLSFYDAIEVKDQLYTLGTYALLSQNRTELTITSDTFTLTVTKPSATENQTIGTDTLAISLPPLGTLYPDAAAVSLIHWKTNVYENQSSVVPDSPTFTLSLLDQSSALVEVSDLPIPIQMGWSLNISDTDPRYLPPPLYMARCDTNELYIQKEDTYEKFTGAEMIEAAKWKVPCLLDSWLFFNCSKHTPFSYEAFECPRPLYTPSCMYWSPVNQTWQSDGCHAVTGNQSFLVCECTHLTDFTGRINAIAQTNQELFANAANVYSLDGLTRYAQWYGTFGGIAAGFLCLAIYLVWKDRVATQRFVKALRTNTSLQHLLRHSPTSPLYRYDVTSIFQTQETVPVNTVSVKSSPDIQTHSRWKQLMDRIAIQHSRLQVFARFDPRLSRLFRLICLFVIQFHSLFVTALLYGFTYSDETTMGIADTILLACITSALNIPVVKLFLRSLNHVGLKEFKYQYALLYSEFKRRAKFETLALAYLKQIHENKSIPQDIQDDIEVVANQQMEVESEETNCINILCAAIPCSRRRAKQSEAQLTKAQLLKQCKECVAVPYPIIEVSSSMWSYMPCHTIQGVLFCMIGFGWFVWCLQYLLLFAASKETHVGTSILSSYATSEITTIFFQQPFIICISYGLIHLLHRFQSRLPKKLQEFLFGERKNNIPALYYFTSPWQQKTHSTLTGEYEYAIFVQCAAAASQVSEHSYAPLRAAAIQLKQDSPSKTHDDDVVRLYDQLWIVQDIQTNKKNATQTSESHSIEASN